MVCRERREKERQQLADLVGKNLTYMSQLEGLDARLYQACPSPLHLLDPVASWKLMFPCLHAYCCVMWLPLCTE